ncbi:MAG: hypothetical protein IPQ14_17480 [Candidatus Microthrix sp.]|uniref:hypothetical protein n=1 Tax=Candidatus Neomicrothrix sp. TaxID=2719034 RepID=UPI0025C2B5E8|nr:hypothetical protein [Candidatus Microthrix sp.]MBL0206062.1 hypothetical protein [Candidatus Microthrix sp.]
MAISAGYSLLATSTRNGVVLAVGTLTGATIWAGVASYLLVRGEHHAIKASFPMAQLQFDPYLTWRAEPGITVGRAGGSR